MTNLALFHFVPLYALAYTLLSVRRHTHSAAGHGTMESKQIVNIVNLIQQFEPSALENGAVIASNACGAGAVPCLPPVPVALGPKGLLTL